MVTVGGLLAFATVSAQQQPLISYVRPLVGTSGYGNTYPGAQIPFGGIPVRWFCRDCRRSPAWLSGF